MLPTDIKDLITAFVLMMFLVAGGSAIQKLDLLGKGEVLENIVINDDKELFLLNYMKSKTSDGKTISDLILEAEDNEEAFNKLKLETIKFMELGFIVNDFDVRINYPNGIKKISNKDLSEFYEIKLPNKKGEIILVKLGVNFRGEES